MLRRTAANSATWAQNGANYSAFFLTAVLQAGTLSPTIPEEANPLKRIDEQLLQAHKGLDVTAVLFQEE